MTTATKAFIDQLSSEQQITLYAGMKKIDRRETTDDALLVGDLFESQLRILGQAEAANQIRAIIRSLREAA